MNIRVLPKLLTIFLSIFFIFSFSLCYHTFDPIKLHSTVYIGQPAVVSAPFFQSLFPKILISKLKILNFFSFHLSPSSAFAQDDYKIGVEDELSVTVWDHPDLTRKIRVNLEGRISFPLIGELDVSGLTPLQLEKKLKELLSQGFIVSPQISVMVTEYRSQKVSIIGEVNSPGSYPLTKKTLLIEAIAMAGGVKSDADLEIMIVRPKEKKKDEKDAVLLPDQVDPSEVIKVRLRDVLEGEKTQNIEVQNFDTIFVPKMKVFYVTGEAKRPGQYTYMKNLTVLKAISTAGGFTEKAAKRQVKIVREKNGKKIEIEHISLDHPIEPSDTIVIPESFW
ncbi:MAG: SLBB domain-containing protein [Proteobacteria bacterium]|nr:SLBB domain-containing protein [Pseudomonadota bacterium]